MLSNNAVGYDFKLEYIETSKFGQADALSRLFSGSESALEEDEVKAEASLE